MPKVVAHIRLDREVAEKVDRMARDLRPLPTTRSGMLGLLVRMGLDAWRQARLEGIAED